MLIAIDTSDLAFLKGEKRILIHSCCAPCSGGILKTLLNSGLECTLFFYDPNIQPHAEYERRKSEDSHFAKKLNIPFAEGPYDPDHWLKDIRGLEHEPERGLRCRRCFEIRLEKTALFAHENHFKIFTSTLGFSRHKDMDMANECGIKAASHHQGLIYWTWNWRKKGITPLSVQIAREEHFYRQNYCGCVYSRDKKESG